MNINFITLDIEYGNFEYAVTFDYSDKVIKIGKFTKAGETYDTKNQKCIKDEIINFVDAKYNAYGLEVNKDFLISLVADI